MERNPHPHTSSIRPPTSTPRKQHAVHFVESNLSSFSADGADGAGTVLDVPGELRPVPASVNARRYGKDGVGHALSDTPLPSGSNSPRIHPLHSNSSSSIPRIRPTTLDIPGLTKSKFSPDGKIASRDVGSKLVIVMVGLPARGKSYITKKTARYLNWLQHDTKIFNVGEKRRVAASAYGETPHHAHLERVAAELMLNGPVPSETHRGTLPKLILPESTATGNLLDSPVKDVDGNGQDSLPSSKPALEIGIPPSGHEDALKVEDKEHIHEGIDQSANFFDPTNKVAAQIREQAASETLDDLLDYILYQGGSVGIFDATNHTLKRRKWVMEKIRAKAGPNINILFIESVCTDVNILESNMRLKLSGPDYKYMDPQVALADFKERVEIYAKHYVPLGEYEERHHMPYVKLMDVGRKMTTHAVNGFIAAQAVYYLLNFNLAPRQIWITRHGESIDNQKGKIGGDSELTANGYAYGRALARFVDAMRKEWDVKQAARAAHAHMPPHRGDHTPPNPHYEGGEALPKNFCVWTSMLKRSIQTAEPFEHPPYDEDFEVKQMRMLNELYAGEMEGLTYEEIRNGHQDEFRRRQCDKMQYRYPGPGGEGYLDVINRLRQVIVELERMTDHCLLICHRSVARVLLAYFKGLKRADVADLDCPLGMLYMLEPKPYGVDFKAYQYDAERDWFHEQPDYELCRASN